MKKLIQKGSYGIRRVLILSTFIIWLITLFLVGPSIPTSFVYETRALADINEPVAMGESPEPDKAEKKEAKEEDKGQREKLGWRPPEEKPPSNDKKKEEPTPEDEKKPKPDEQKKIEGAM